MKIRLCAYRLQGANKCGLWVEHPDGRVDRMKRIITALRDAYDEGHGLELAYEDWDE